VRDAALATANHTAPETQVFKSNVTIYTNAVRIGVEAGKGCKGIVSLDIGSQERCPRDTWLSLLHLHQPL